MDSSRAEAKRAEETVSGWLGRWDISSPVNPWLPGRQGNRRRKVSCHPRIRLWEKVSGRFGWRRKYFLASAYRGLSHSRGKLSRKNRGKRVGEDPFDFLNVNVYNYVKFF